MNDQITMEDMQSIIGKLTINYELQILKLQQYIQDIQTKLNNLEADKVE